MDTSTTTSADRLHRSSARTWWSLAPAFIVVIASIGYQIPQGTTTDVSWLITSSERLLAARTAYVDFFELNPPASILLYVPAVAAARIVHVAPEFAVKAFVYLVFAANIALCRATGCDSRAVHGVRPGTVMAALAAIYLLLPGDVFAQREHLIALLLLPVLSVLAARADGLSPRPGPAIAAGIEAGMAVAIKPFFVLAIALPLAFALWRSRRSRGATLRIVLAPELAVFALTVAAYLAVVFVCFPAFLTRGLPIALDVYSLYTNSHLAFLHSWNAILWASAAGLAWLLGPRRGRNTPIIVPLLASLGCVGAMMLQAKYFDYHAYPSVAMALTALAAVLAGRWADLPRRQLPRLALALGSAVALGLFARALVWFAAPAPNEALRRAMAELAPRPRIMALSMGHGLAHPLVRQLGGTFVGRLASPWMYFLIVRAFRDPSLPAARRLVLQGYIDLEKRVTAEDIERERPDYILVSSAFATDRKVETWPFIDENWIKSTPALVAAFAGYAAIRTVGDVTIWRRASAAEPRRSPP